MRRPHPPIYYERVATARRRIRSVMRRRLVAYSKELERQVCEVGFDFAKAPLSERPEPVHFSVAIKDLLTPRNEDDEPELSSETVHVIGERQATFYVYRYGSRDEIARAFDRKLDAVRAYLRVESHPPYSGWHAEQVHHSALTDCDDWWSVGWQGGVKIERLHTRRLSVGSVDLAAVHRPTGIAAVAEVKNTREWFYDTDAAVWGLLGAAAELDAVPVLIARRVAEPTFRLMKAIGGFASVATKLILPPEVAALPPHVSPSLTEAEQEWLLRREQLLARIQHREPRTELPPPRTEPSFADAVRELGFHSDIDFVPSDQPLSRHRTLWRVHLPDRAGRSA